MGKLSLLTVPFKAISKVFGVAERHPKMVYGGAAIAGWNHFFNGENSAYEKMKRNGGLMKEAGDAAFGYDVNARMRNKIDNVVSGNAGQEQEQQQYSSGMEQGMSSEADGVQNFMSSMSGNSSMSVFDRLGNFISNMFSGNVKTSNIAGLMLGMWMMFRMGIWGKLGGALLSMLMVGNNSQQQQQPMQQQPSMAQSQEQQSSLQRQDGVGVRR